MNKKLLSIAVAAGVAGLGGVAHAVDFTATTPTPVSVASETTIAPAGTGITGAAVTATFEAGFSVDDSNARYIRIDITNGTWGAQQVSSDMVADDSSGADNASVTFSAGGAATDSHVIYTITSASAGNTVAATNDVDFTPNGGITVTSQESVAMTYQLFETASAAVANDGGALANDSGTLITFVAANNTVADTATPNAIDVTTSVGTGAVFVGGNTNIIGAVNTTDSGAVNTTGSTLASANIEASSSLSVTGDFTFVQDLTAGAPDGTYTLTSATLDSAPNCAGSTLANATSITDTTAVFTTSGINPDIMYVCVNANGVSLIAEQGFTAAYASVGASGYANESTDLTLASLAKNGASAGQVLVLTPGGAFQNFLRVSNTSNISGDVTFSVTNDAGTTVTGVSMGDISGQSSSSLAGQASSSLINIDDLYAAAQAADATFDAAGGKLRVTATGNFGSVSLQNITLSTDNTTFATF